MHRLTTCHKSIHKALIPCFLALDVLHFYRAVHTPRFRAGSINSSPDNVVINPDSQLLRFPTSCPTEPTQLGSLKINAATSIPTTLLITKEINGIANLAEYIENLVLVSHAYLMLDPSRTHCHPHIYRKLGLNDT